MSERKKALITLAAAGGVILLILALGLTLPGGTATNFAEKSLSPSLAHPFGTDWLGRDMLARTLKGLVFSIAVGLIAASVSTVIAVVLGIFAATFGKWADALINFMVDLCQGIPHILLMILIAFVLGGGVRAIIVSMALTHWPSMTRLIRSEVMQLRSMPYVQVSRRLGRGRMHIAARHILPHLWPQIIVGFILLFPHAILHEASLTFLGFGLSVQQPAVGIILSEAMKYLATGQWWLAFFPGLMLLIVVRLFDRLGDSARMMVDPTKVHR
ncbi:ABC transporter permease [Gehongia tenuis]|uniref:ABC transporter permease n=1 Tax=Gehongia tenuis TaxID=2763655 RepID=A0A926D2F6_9FIRM|nr:ABC transporter permease [Gehongia tenuis]MBC8530513.1 ABC transporter permease [Gehongia tenuis]